MQKKPFWAFFLGLPTKEDSSSSFALQLCVILAGLGALGLGGYYRWFAPPTLENKEGGIIALVVGLIITFGNFFGSYYAWKNIKPGA